MLEACKNCIIWLDNSMKNFYFHHSVFQRQGRSGKWHFFYVIFSGGIWLNFTFSSTQFGMFFPDFYWDMSGNWINTNNLSWNTVVMKKIGKTFKKCSFRTIFGQNLDKHGPHPKSSSMFFVEITEGDHKLSRTFYFIKIS